MKIEQTRNLWTKITDAENDFISSQSVETNLLFLIEAIHSHCIAYGKCVCNPPRPLDKDDLGVSVHNLDKECDLLKAKLEMATAALESFTKGLFSTRHVKLISSQVLRSIEGIKGEGEK